ncbi:hypothetical protein D623_10019795 [Myotis brandtii]|uniref:Uncharacterized protein n=1 Tax=Myotis brandtii TaxID=109478 RepID=S7QCS6_MYOBR|nr:hypothetical protein D623_10019795 [Myotis brandtii]
MFRVRALRAPRLQADLSTTAGERTPTLLLQAHVGRTLQPCASCFANGASAVAGKLRPVSLNLQGLLC